MVVCAVPIGAAGHRIQSDYVKSRFHFSTIRKNIFLWVEECERLSSTIDVKVRRGRKSQHI